MQTTIHKEVQEVVYSIKRESLYSILMEDAFLRFMVISFAIIGYIAILANNALLASVLALWCGFILLGLYVGKRPNDDNSNAASTLVENKENKTYMINIATEIKKFYGDAVKSGKKMDNKIKPLLLSTETTKRHGSVLATTGAGKSVLMKGMIEQILVLGGGGLFIDGKGTAEFAKEIYGLVAKYGREDDFYYINFLDMNNTHTINPLLSGSALALYEILISLLDGEQNEWRAKQETFMKNILKLLVWQRDNENLALDFSVLSRYLTLDALVESAIKYRDKVFEYIELDDFVTYVATAIDMSFDNFITLSKDEIIAKLDEAQKEQKQGAYDCGMAAQAWIGIVTNLKSDYGRVFNTQNPDISLWEATQRNKIIFVTLPTMASDTTPKALGKLILGLIKNVADQKARNAKDPKIPFLLLLDEVGSYITEGFGRLMSKSRMLGMSVWFFFQSFSQIDVVGKMLSGESSERQEAMGMIGTHIIMKSTDPKATEYYQGFAPKKVVLEKSYSERRDFAKGNMNVEQNYSPKETPAFEHNEIVAMNNGEMIMLSDGLMYRAIARAESCLLENGKKITYEGSPNKLTAPLPITQYLSKKEFFTMMKEYEEFKSKKVA